MKKTKGAHHCEQLHDMVDQLYLARRSFWFCLKEFTRNQYIKAIHACAVRGCNI